VIHPHLHLKRSFLSLLPTITTAAGAASQQPPNQIENTFILFIFSPPMASFLSKFFFNGSKINRRGHFVLKKRKREREQRAMGEKTLTGH
jgi:hypothetical protein